MYDVCVVGGGMVGGAVALGLARSGLTVAVLEAHMPSAYNSAQPPDIRVSAIGLASVKLLESLGAWQHIATKRLCPLRHLAVWENSDARTQFNAADADESVLGYIVENRIIQLGLLDAVAQHSNITLYQDATPADIRLGQPNRVTLSSGEEICARLLVGADGARSRVRQAAGIGTHGWQYSQHAMGILVKTDGQQDITWQQFHPCGPRAFLPMYDGYASLVWYDEPTTLKALGSLSKGRLKEQIVQQFPAFADDFDVLQHAAFPLTRMHANDYVKAGVVLVGDAAHTINPLAGQGVNLGYRDVAALLDVVNGAIEKNDDIGSPDVLKAYQAKRRKDNLLMMSVMDAIYMTFSNDITPLKHLRNLGLKLADAAGPVKTQVMKYAMGI
ncbi:FAD-dependent oxidoreductase [Aestuariibacter salexigens]|uniref:FAD-dependent oxidoreductase n=1 Tax=Aestuariibacter salexigens TaxID=226010 RepID=UPI00042232DB|nr:FAD-dependent oxidoreductase [Aestuariibacter salexigens]